MNKRIPLHKAILYITASLIIVALSVTGLLRGIRYFKGYLAKSPTFAIKELIQSSGTSERLPTAYLSEMLGLSSNVPSQLTLFNVHKAKERLLISPMIKRASLKKKRPNTLLIHYHMRTPIALVGDIYNGALDEDGVVFPLRPYYAPKKLPEIYLGETIERFGQKMAGKPLDVALDVLFLLKETVNMQEFMLEAIDVTNLSHQSLGHRCIVVVVSNKYARHYIRLHYKKYEEALANYLEMQGELFFQERESFAGKLVHKVIDLRIPGYAYVDKTY